jgi:TonB family protein
MFDGLKRPSRQRLNLAVLGSVAVHSAILWVLCLRPAAIFAGPALIANGERGASSVLYFTPPGNQQLLVAERSKHTPARLYLRAKPKTKFNARITNQKDVEPQNPDPVSTASAGSPNSTDLYGATTGSDIRPAIETTLLDPPVSKTEIPAGVEGDVIIEITIDEQGYVTGTKLLQGLGYGVDEKILATVRNWHYRPATRDGIPIPSKYDARWHFRGRNG